MSDMKAMVDEEYFKLVKETILEFPKELEQILKAEVENAAARPDDEYTDDQKDVN